MHRGGHLFHLTLHVRRVGLGEDRADHGGDHLLLVPRDLHEHVAHEVHATALPTRPGKDLGDRGLEPQVRVTDHELNAVKTAFAQ